MKPLLFHFPEDELLALRIADLVGAEVGGLEWHFFPDQESLITLHGNCTGRNVILVSSLTRADVKALPLHFFAITARELGARRVGLIAPYLAYMRQDRRFAEGQTVSAHAFAQLLSTIFDWLMTIDPHLHRIENLTQIFSIPAIAVSSMPAVSEWIRQNVQDPVLIGPDRESAQWAGLVAQALDAPYFVLEKVRHGDYDVSISSVDASLLAGRHPVVIDDIASSGRTLIETTHRLTAAGAREITCVIVHALLSKQAQELLMHAGATRIVSTNTVPHPTNAIDVAPLLAAALQRHRIWNAMPQRG